MDLLKILDTAPEPAIVDARTMGVSGDTSGDYWLPAPMCLYQKELTDQIVSLHYSDILKYFETTDYKEDVVLQSMKTMCLNSQLVATHPYLLIDHFMPKSLLTKDIPVHLAETSGKFAVLRDLMNLIQEYETHTLIVCRPGRTMDLIEALLLGNKVNIKRYDGQSIKSKQKKTRFSCTCHLLPSEAGDESQLMIDPNIRLNLMICVDPTVDTNIPYIQRILKQHQSKFGIKSIVPTIRLAVINSIDHCELYFGKTFDRNTRDYLVNVSAAMVVLRDVVGTLPPDLRPIYSQNLRYLVDWLDIPERPWPLPDVYPIKIYTPMDVERSLLTEVKYTQTNDTLEEAFSIGKKRNFRYNDNDSIGSNPLSYYQNKRLKNDYITNPLRQDMAQVTGIYSSQIIDSNMDYHFSSGILTHKLIQAIGAAYDNLKKQNTEVEHFRNAEGNQKRLLELHKSDLFDINRKLKESTEKRLKNELEVQGYLKQSEAMRNKIENLETDIDNLFNALSSRKGELTSVLKETIRVEQELKGQEHASEIKSVETDYMVGEIKRATDSIENNEKEKEQLIEDIEKLENLIQESIIQDKKRHETTKGKIGLLESDIAKECKAITGLKTQMTIIMEYLKQLQTPRVRSPANGNKIKHRNQV
ncbi:Hda3p Ecym_2809 [Eremothecium cymbalariae DBVPG|uniref:HDA1 complex subunit 3 n=1 Tax=Eremothecium cymbalariae (strain CBS 270.75 / DBVPG 7215 / KCTC 17166 / NRRL Y-17582) TaxID=931890 RepID=G8JQE3_ERECY|nr:Hypothetical protein Ecym_2809 [Eremothecium cymbalariae DBVPG\